MHAGDSDAIPFRLWDPEDFVNSNPGSFDLKVFGCVRPQEAHEAIRERDARQEALTEEQYCLHAREYTRRVQWCVEQGPAYWPAQEHKHKAPGDDSNFCFGVPPWYADGSPNPLGIPDNRSIEQPMKGFELPLEWNSDIGWSCHKCQEWIPRVPRPFEGPREPDDWWWCFECRKNKPKVSQKEKTIRALVERNKDIRQFTEFMS